MAKQPKTISRTEPPATPVEPAGTTTAASVLEEPSSEPVKTAPSAEAGDPKAVVESFNPLATPKHVFSWERAEQKETKP
jgi:hypothetical protein